jgi:hypothetical protein
VPGDILPRAAPLCLSFPGVHGAPRQPRVVLLPPRGSRSSSSVPSPATGRGGATKE